MLLARVIARVISVIEWQWLGPGFHQVDGLKPCDSFSFDNLKLVDAVQRFISVIFCFSHNTFKPSHCPRVITSVVCVSATSDSRLLDELHRFPENKLGNFNETLITLHNLIN